MADDDLDLTTGETAAERRRRRRRSGSSGGGEEKPPRETASDSEVKTTLGKCFDRIAKMLEAKNGEDDELATAIRQDADAMGQGLVSLTAKFTPLRFPLIVVLSLVEPIMAFWNVGRIMRQRIAARLRRRAEAQAQAQADWEAAVAENGGEVPEMVQ